MRRASSGSFRRLPTQLISTKAKQIYEQRVEHGRIGTPEEDWDEATRQLQNRRIRYITRAVLWCSRIWRWTGISEKKGWDFVGILIVPLTLAMVTHGFQESGKLRDREALEISKVKDQEKVADKWREDILEKYFKELQDMLGKGLLTKKYGDADFLVAQTKTVLALQQLDGNRQRLLIQFLEATGLNSIDKKGILYQAKMQGSSLEDSNLAGVRLEKADLSEANLYKADLSRANLVGAIMSRSNLSEARLSAADLTSTQLDEARLFRADLSCATLKNTNLRKSYLNGAWLDIDRDIKSGCSNRVSPKQQIELADLADATYNTKTAHLIKMGRWTIDENWLTRLITALPFVHRDSERVYVKETAAIFPKPYNEAQNRECKPEQSSEVAIKCLKMKEENGLVKTLGGV